MAPDDRASSTKGVFVSLGLKFSAVTSNLYLLNSITKHEVNTKLITQLESNSRDDSIKTN